MGIEFSFCETKTLEMGARREGMGVKIGNTHTHACIYTFYHKITA